MVPPGTSSNATIPTVKTILKTQPIGNGPAFGPMAEALGKKNGKLMRPSACVDFHPFAATLMDWSSGVPVDCGVQWAWETIEAAVEKGAHKSATSAESIQLIAEDVAYQVQAGYAEVILWFHNGTEGDE